MADNQVVTVSGYTTSWPCNFLLLGLMFLWTYFGWNFFYERWGLPGWIIWGLLGGSLYWMPAVVIVQPIEPEEELDDEEDDEEDDLVSDE